MTQEYGEIKGLLGDAIYAAVVAYLESHPDVILSDIYFDDDTWPKFEQWCMHQYPNGQKLIAEHNEQAKHKEEALRIRERESVWDVYQRESEWLDEHISEVNETFGISLIYDDDRVERDHTTGCIEQYDSPEAFRAGVGCEFEPHGLVHAYIAGKYIFFNECSYEETRQGREQLMED